MARRKTVTDEAILAVARSHFLASGLKASTKKIASSAGISEAVVFQRFSTKEDLFFASMVPPPAQLEEIFSVQPGEETMADNLLHISLHTVAYFKAVMPVFLALIGHPAFSMETFLQRHAMPRIQIGHRLSAYLLAEAKLGRIRRAPVEPAVAMLLAYLHHLAMSETIGDRDSAEASGPDAIANAITLLLQGLVP